MKQPLRVLHLVSMLLLLALLRGPASAAGPAGVAQLPAAMPALAKTLLQHQAAEPPGDLEARLNGLLRLHLAADDPAAALAALSELRALHASQGLADAELGFTPYELYARALLAGGASFEAAFQAQFRERLRALPDAKAWRVGLSLGFDRAQGEATLAQAFAQVQQEPLRADRAMDLVRAWVPHRVFGRIGPLVDALLDEEEAARYTRQAVQMRGPDGATLVAHVVLPRSAAGQRLPTALQFTIYAEAWRPWTPAVQAASQGFAGVVAFSRGKAGSPDAIRPYEHEVTDVNAVIDWISKQPWGDGRVGMYGGSYNGFAQWAALKHPHPALKTIVPYVAAIPGLGLPMENNVFLTANYGWAFYVGNHAFLDNAVYNDRPRWNALGERWYRSGRPFREIDAVDGTPNPLLQRWLAHPAFDAYWQAMVPWGEDFARIAIPVLSITGYYDDGQISAIEYLKQHERHRPGAPHYLVIGPYDHVGAQQYRKPLMLRGYGIDPVAQLDTPALTFEWLRHVLRGGPLPALLKDRVNAQLMGANRWLSAPSLKALEQVQRRFYLNGDRLADTPPAGPGTAGSMTQGVDFRDRQTSTNDRYYPSPILGAQLESGGGLVFTSAPLQHAATLAGTFSGLLRISVNKRDVDLGVVLYELTAEGRYLHLSYFLGRASHARDMSRRVLLQPGRVTDVPFSRTRMVARELRAGSRLVAVVGVNKNEGAQLNHGSGADVSRESIADAGEPLRIRFHPGSWISLPMR